MIAMALALVNIPTHYFLKMNNIEDRLNSKITELCEEIKNLRRRNEILEAKVTTFEACFQMLQTSPYYGTSVAGVDIVWEAKKLQEQFVKSKVAQETEAAESEV